MLYVPLNYDPQKRYPVSIFLHGAVSNTDPNFLFKTSLDTTSNAYRLTESILIYPAGWLFAPWWSNLQVENIDNLISTVKNSYNIDENQIRLGGVSDGGTGSFYLANCNSTKWSCVTPFIGSLDALGALSPRQVYMNNFSKTPAFVVNTGRDHIFPKKNQVPFLNLLTKINPKAHVQWVDSSGHSMQWYNVLRDSINSFVKHQPRNPFPDEIIWQTENKESYGRHYFVLIDAISKSNKNSSITDANEVTLAHGQKIAAYRRNELSGIIKVKRDGNTFHVSSVNVNKFTLLLSSDFIDYNHPVIVYSNGVVVLNKTITPDLNTLFKWNIMDNDRTMLFDAELHLSSSD
jgi:predicted esterase